MYGFKWAAPSTKPSGATLMDLFVPPLQILWRLFNRLEESLDLSQNLRSKEVCLAWSQAILQQSCDFPCKRIRSLVLYTKACVVAIWLPRILFYRWWSMFINPKWSFRWGMSSQRWSNFARSRMHSRNTNVKSSSTIIWLLTNFSQHRLRTMDKVRMWPPLDPYQR